MWLELGLPFLRGALGAEEKSSGGFYQLFSRRVHALFVSMPMMREYVFVAVVFSVGVVPRRISNLLCCFSIYMFFTGNEPNSMYVDLIACTAH